MRSPFTCTLLVLLCSACRVLESPVGDLDPRAIDELLASPVAADLDQSPDYPWTHEADPEEQQESQEPPRPRIAGDERVALELRNVPLSEAVHLIAERAGVNVVLDADLSEPVSASLPSVTLDDALSIILAQNHLTLVKEEGDIFLVQRNDGSRPALATFQLRSVHAADVVENLTQLLGPEATVVADTNQNVILVNGTEAHAAMAREYLRGADRLKPQVLLEVRILEASLDDTFQFGITQHFDGSIDGNTWNVLQALATPGNNFSTTFDKPGDVNVTINALRDHVGLELISAPRVMAITNTQAKVEIVEQVPYIQTTSSVDTGASSSSFSQVEFKEAGIKLLVTPTVQEAGILQVDIDQELSEVVGTFLDVPIIDVRKFVTQFLVADRQTIVLGGLMQQGAQDKDRGVPGLERLPGLGRLFRADEDQSKRRELLVFLTPRILDPNQAASMAKELQSEYRQATRIMRSDLGQGRTEAEKE